MDLLITTTGLLLIAIAVAPLLLLALYALASHFDLPIADRILDGSVRLLKLQWVTGSIVSLGVGAGLAGLGIWVTLHADSAAQCWVGGVVIVFGLWRAWRGFALIRRTRLEDEEA